MPGLLVGSRGQSAEPHGTRGVCSAVSLAAEGASLLVAPPGASFLEKGVPLEQHAPHSLTEATRSPVSRHRFWHLSPCFCR